MNNRLDFISKFQDGTVEKMTELRKQFMALDNELRQLIDPNQKDVSITPALARAVSISRTHIEDAMHYAIKSLCLKYEVK